MNKEAQNSYSKFLSFVLKCSETIKDVNSNKGWNVILDLGDETSYD